MTHQDQTAPSARFAIELHQVLAEDPQFERKVTAWGCVSEERAFENGIDEALAKLHEDSVDLPALVKLVKRLSDNGADLARARFEASARYGVAVEALRQTLVSNQ